jgi:hypothetical protein
MSLQGRRKGIKTLLGNTVVRQCSRQEYILNAYRQDGLVRVVGQGDLASHVARVAGISRDHQKQHLTVSYCLLDTVSPVFHPGGQIVFCNPTVDIVSFEHFDDLVGGRLVFRGMANEYVVGHRLYSSGKR